MTNDELADAFHANLTELHEKIDALEDGSRKRRFARLARVAHGALEQLQEEVLDADMIQPFSGGGDKPPVP